MSPTFDPWLPFSQFFPLNPLWQRQTPSTQRPRPLQSWTSHSSACTEHSAPFHSGAQWHIPPLYTPWPEQSTGHRPEKKDKHRLSSFNLLRGGFVARTQFWRGLFTLAAQFRFLLEIAFFSFFFFPPSYSYRAWRGGRLSGYKSVTLLCSRT